MALRCRYCHPHFMDEEIKAQRDVITCLRSHTLGLGLFPVLQSP